MIDREVRPEQDSAVAVPSGSDRADFLLFTKGHLGRRYPEVSLAGLPERGGARLVLATSDLAAANKPVGGSGVRSADALLRRTCGGQWHVFGIYQGIATLRSLISLANVAEHRPPTQPFECKPCQ